MTYDAVSAYTVLFGDGDGPVTVSVHGSAHEAWGALSALVEPPARRRSAWHGRSGRTGRSGAPTRDLPVDEARISAAAERWRLDDPERRFWQVAPHRLQVTVPAIGSGPVVPRSA